MSPTTPAPSPSAAPQPTPIPRAVQAAPQPYAEKPRRWPLFVGGALLLLALGGAGSTVGIYKAWHDSGKIAPNVSIEGVDVSGLTPTEAKQKVQQQFSALQVAVETPEKTYTFPLDKIGGQPQWSFAATRAEKIGREGTLLSGAWRYWTGNKGQEHHLPLQLSWQKTPLRRVLQDAAKSYAVEPRDARLRVVNGGVTVVDGENGRALDWIATAKQLQLNGITGFASIGDTPTLNDKSTLSVKAPITSVTPRITAASLQGRDVPLGLYTTSFNRGLAGRTRNLHVAAEAIEGHVLMPGEKFSFNESTGERTWDKGYRMGHIFERQPGESEAQVVDGLAGGVCQISSTLYNAVRKTNQKLSKPLKIVERNHHSLPVTYVPTGLDATVAWPYKDFRFRNTLDYPVYLRTAFSGSRVTISVWARVPFNASDPVTLAAADA